MCKTDIFMYVCRKYNCGNLLCILKDDIVVYKNKISENNRIHSIMCIVLLIIY